jgi:hypothetical protein
MINPTERTDTMKISFDCFKYVCDVIAAAGFRRAGSLQDHPGRVFRNGPRTVVVIPPVKIRVPRRGDRVPGEMIRDQFESDLRRIIDNVRSLQGEVLGRTTLVFMGGGTIPLPDWFREAMAEMGFEIVILDPEQVLRGDVGELFLLGG